MIQSQILTHMNNQFVPHKVQEIVVVKITKREAILLQKLRKYAFGEFVIHKANGLFVRVEIKESQIIEEDIEIDTDLL